MQKTGLLWAILVLMVLTGCGGGNGGNDNSSNGIFNVDTNNISFTGRIGQSTPYAATINGTLTNAKDDPYFVVDVSQTDLVEEVYVELDSLSRGRLIVIPSSPDDIVPGVHTGIVKINVCKDSACKQHFAGSPTTITVNYTVTAPEFQISPSSVVFDMYEHQPPPFAQDLTLTSPESEYFNRGVTYSSEQNWLGAAIVDQKIRLSVVKNLPAGSYTANTSVFAFSKVIAKPVSVVLNVRKLPVQLNEITWDVNINATTFDGSETRALNLTSATSAPVDWTATSDVDWLSVSQSSGAASSTVSNITVEINEAVLKLRSGAWVGKISLQGADESIPPSTYAVNLTLNKPEIVAVAPAVGLVGKTYKVNLYGNNIGNNIDRIRINNNQPTSISKLSDSAVQTEIQVTEAGDIKFSFGDSIIDYMDFSATFSAKASINSLPETQMDLEDYGWMPVFDAIHDQVYVVAHHPHDSYGDSTTLQKFYQDEGTWTLKNLQVENCPVNDIQLSRDGAQLALLCGALDIVVIDTETFTIKKRWVFTNDGLIPGPEILGIFYRTNHDLLIASRMSLASIDLVSGKITPVETNSVDAYFYMPRMLATADLSSIYILENGLSFNAWVRRYNSLDQELYPTNIDQAHYGYESASLDGKWLIFGAGLYDTNLNYKESIRDIRRLALSGDIGWGFDFSNSTVLGYSLNNHIAGDYTPLKTIPLSLTNQESFNIFASADNKRLFIIRGSQIAVVNAE